jgi:ribonuclease HI
MTARVTLLHVAAAEASTMTGFGYVVVEGDATPIAKGLSEEKQGDLLRGHLQAFVHGLQFLTTQKPSGGRDSVLLVAHHEFLTKGVEEWMPRWKQNGWRTASRKPVAYVELWQKVDELIELLKTQNSGDVLLWKGRADHGHQKLALAVAQKSAQVGLEVTGIGQISKPLQADERPYDGCNNEEQRRARDEAIALANDGSLPWAA